MILYSMPKTNRKREYHGLGHSKAYGVWCGMRSRCYSKTNPAYKNYGERGIAICEQWGKFSQFYADMGDPPPGKSLDRIDNNAGYSLGNCRWADRGQQSRNRRNNIIVTLSGETHTLMEWAAIIGLPYKTLHQRRRLGWNIEAAITTPLVHQKDRHRPGLHVVEYLGERLSVTALCERVGKPYYLVKNRLTRGWPLERAIL